MIIIDHVLIDPSLLQSNFKCSLMDCKGACCVEGERGAPVTGVEITEIEKILERVLKYLPEKNRAAIAEQGIYEAYQGELYLTAVDGKECVFASIDHHGIASCNLEKAYLNGETTFHKPISCHLFPIRVRRRFGMDELTYMQIPECQTGRLCGAAEEVPIYEFLAPALTRKYGASWTAQFLNTCRRKKYHDGGAP
jgi:hypothetical protein